MSRLFYHTARLAAVPALLFCLATTAFAQTPAAKPAGFPLLGSIGLGLLAILLGALCGRAIRSFAAKSLQKQEEAAKRLKNERNSARKQPPRA